MNRFLRRLFAHARPSARPTLPRFRPALMTMEDRYTPAVSAALAGGSLTLTGTPNVGGVAVVVRHIGSDQYQVFDGPADRGTYRVTRDLRVDLTSVVAHQVIRIDLAGDTLPGKLTARVGSGDAAVVVTNSSAAPAKVNGNVALTVGTGGQTLLLTPIYNPETGEPAHSGPLEVRGDVRVENGSATDLARDRFEAGPNTTVRGAVAAHGIATTIVQGRVDGSVQSEAPGTPDGAWFFLEGSVGGSLRVTGGVPAGADGFNWYGVLGPVGGSCTLAAAGGATDVTVAAMVGGSFVYNGTASADYVTMLSGTRVGGSAVLDFGSATDEFSGTQIQQVLIGGSLVVSGRGGGLTDVQLGVRYYTDPETGAPLPQLPTVGGAVVVALTGGGENYATFDLAPESAPFGVAYVGGAGADWVTVNGHNTYPLIVLTGGGDDTVEFTPDAAVGSAYIDFGTAPGTKVFTPPTVVGFTLVLRNYP